MTGRRIFRTARILLVLFIMIAAAYFYASSTRNVERIAAQGEKIHTADGDSFTIGRRGFRLMGIDAPELAQKCTDEAGQSWPCGEAARGALMTILSQPALICEAEFNDRYKRALANCKTQNIPDIAAEMVMQGWAISHEFNGVRDYGAQEDSARRAKKGIWRGEFTNPKIWRDQNPRR